MARRLVQPSVLFAAYTAILVVALLAPFDFFTPNGATLKALDHAVEFPTPGIVRTLVPPRRLHRDLTSGAGFTLEVWLKSGKSNQIGPARIVSYSADTRARNFTLGQQGDTLVMRLRTTETDANGIPPLEVTKVFAAMVRRHIVVTYDVHGLCVYVDGRRQACRTSPNGHLDVWDPGHHLLFGNETTANRPWLGTLFLVALYDRGLSAAEIAAAYTAGGSAASTVPAAGRSVAALYGFGEGSGSTVHDATPRDPIHLAVPRFVEEHRHRFLSRKSTLAQMSAGAVADVTLNVLMFVPFGHLCHAALRRRGWRPAAASAAAIAIAAAFSLGIESAQYFIVSRGSQLEDVVLNVLGAGLGVALGSILRSPFDLLPS
jgi:VanZ like family/Concanavalin A-like lectin/glucanases superfamily